MVAFEFGGAFITSEDEYFWVASKVNGEYAQDTMYFAIFPLVSSTETEFLEAVLAMFNGKVPFDATNCPEFTKNDVIAVSEEATCYNLVMDETSFQTVFRIGTTGPAAVAIFTEHHPEEFGEPYYLDIDGHVTEPNLVFGGAGHPPPPDEILPQGNQWEAMGASAVVLLVTLVGVIFLAPKIAALKDLHSNRFDSIVYAFSSGALLATTFFLVLFEPVHLLGYVYPAEVDIAWRWGTSILAGFMASPALGTLLSLVETAIMGPRRGIPSYLGEENTEEDVSETRRRLLFSTLIGDALHNFVDGVFIGVAFQLCSKAVGWTVAVTTVLHELAQELADYQLLVFAARLEPKIALAVNFGSGLSVLLGTLIAILADVGDEATAIILCVGGGVYLQLGACEAMPRVYKAAQRPMDKVWGLFAFIFGCVCIGLVLLDHTHCHVRGHEEVEEEGHNSHGGHSHDHSH